MRIHFTIAALAAAACLQAQTVLPLGQPLTSPNNGNSGGAVYFNFTCNTVVTWDEIEYVASDVSPAGNSSLEIYFGPAQWQGNVANQTPWILIGQSTPVAIPGGGDTVVQGVLSGAGANTGTVTFAPGTYGIALVAQGHSWGYQNGVFTFSDPNISITTGGASNAPFSLPTFSPRSVNGNLTYTIGGTPIALASSQIYGEGCYANYTSFYEVFANTSTSQDLENTSLLLQFNTTAGAYDVVSGTTAPVPQGPNAQVQTFADDDTAVQVALGGLPITYVVPGGIQTSPVDPLLNDFVAQMGPDGWVGLDAVLNTSGNPDAATFLAEGARVGNWHDMSPTTGGTAWYEFDATNAAHIFTWEAVPSRGTTGPNTIQIVFFPTLDIEIRLGTLNLAVGGGWPTLVGYTPGNGALDPLATDISAATPFATSTVDTNPLRLDIDAAPVLGQTVNLVTTDETTTPGIGATLFSTVPLNGNPLPPIDLLILNAPGCFANVGTLDVSLPIFSGAASSPFPIPNSPGFIGFEIAAQSLWLDPSANQFGIITSNGVLLKLGV